jgi:hypothetical protein
MYAQVRMCEIRLYNDNDTHQIPRTCTGSGGTKVWQEFGNGQARRQRAWTAKETE